MSIGTSAFSIAMKDMGFLIEAAQANMKYLPGPVYNVIGYGAKGDGVRDDTIAIQKAVNAAGANGGGVVFFPPGIYLVSSTITISQQYVKLKGSGRYTTIIQRSNPSYGHTIYFNGDGLYGVGISEITINQVQNEMTSGAHLCIRGCIEGEFHNLGILSGYEGITVKGGARHNFYDIWCSHALGTNGHSFYKVEFDNTIINNTATSIKFTQCDALELNSEKAVDYGFFISSSDGIQFSDCHVQGCKEASLYILGEDTPKLIGLLFSNCYFDDNGNRCVTIEGTTSNFFSDFQFSNCIFRVSVNTMMFNINGNVKNINFNGCDFRESAFQAIVINSTVSGVNIVGCTFSQNNTVNSAASYDIVIQGGAQNIAIKCNQFRRSGQGGAINLAAGASDNISICNNDFSEMTSPSPQRIVDSGATGTNVIYANNMGHVPEAVASTFTIKPSTGELFRVTGTNDISDMDIRPAGTRVSLLFTDPLTVNAGNNLFLRSNFSANSNYILTLVSDGMKWYSVGE